MCRLRCSLIWFCWRFFSSLHATNICVKIWIVVFFSAGKFRCDYVCDHLLFESGQIVCVIAVCQLQRICFCSSIHWFARIFSAFDSFVLAHKCWQSHFLCSFFLLESKVFSSPQKKKKRSLEQCRKFDFDCFWIEIFFSAAYDLKSKFKLILYVIRVLSSLWIKYECIFLNNWKLKKNSQLNLEYF